MNKNLIWSQTMIKNMFLKLLNSSVYLENHIFSPETVHDKFLVQAKRIGLHCFVNEFDSHHNNPKQLNYVKSVAFCELSELLIAKTATSFWGKCLI